MNDNEKWAVTVTAHNKRKPTTFSHLFVVAHKERFCKCTHLILLIDKWIIHSQHSIVTIMRGPCSVCVYMCDCLYLSHHPWVSLKLNKETRTDANHPAHL